MADMCHFPPVLLQAEPSLIITPPARDTEGATKPQFLLRVVDDQGTCSPNCPIIITVYYYHYFACVGMWV